MFHKLVLFVLSLPVAFPVWGAPNPPAPALPQPISRFEGYRLQPTDEPLGTFTPDEPVTEADRRKRRALAHYMTGLLHQKSRENREALKAYMTAIEFDPSAIDSYRAAIPLLLQDRRVDDATNLSLKAIGHTEDGVDLVQTMAAVFARQNKLSDSVDLLQKALKSPAIKASSVSDLLLHRDLGLYLRSMTDFDKAAEQYKYVFDAITEGQLTQEEIERVIGEDGKLLDEFGDVFVKAKQPELALSAFEEASKYRDATPGLHSFNLARVFQQTGKPERALEELQKYFDAQLQNRGRAAYDLLKALLEELGKEDELLARLRELYEQDDKNDVLRYFLADVLFDAGKLQDAEKLYRNDKDQLTDPRAIVGVFSIIRERNNPEELLDLLTKTYVAFPRDADERPNQSADVKALTDRFDSALEALKEDTEALDRLYAFGTDLTKGDEPKLEFAQAYVLGKFATEIDRTDDAKLFYRYAIDMRNDPQPVLYTELGMHLLDAKRYEESIEILREGLEHPSGGLQNERWKFLFFLSYAHEFLGQTDEAIEAIREAQKLLPRFSRLFFQEAWVFYHARQWDEALRLFNDVIERFGTDRDLVQDCRFRISNIYVEQGNMEQGEAVLEEVLKEQPENAQANNDLGYLWADQGKNLAKARKMIELAIEKEPENPAYQDSLGWVLYQQGEYEAALKHLNKASEDKDGQDSVIYEHRGDCLDKLGRKDEAIADWTKALEIEKDKGSPSEKILKSLKSKLGME